MAGIFDDLKKTIDKRMETHENAGGVKKTKPKPEASKKKKKKKDKPSNSDVMKFIETGEY